ncbi:hypothetical protein ACWERV_17140 [Streptomyces sp. NPDC004031]
MSTDDLRQRIAAALSAAGAFCGECGFAPGDRGCPDCERCWASYADALLPLVIEVRAAELREVADLVAANVTCSCPVCRARRDTAAMIRARADRIRADAPGRTDRP